MFNKMKVLRAKLQLLVILLVIGIIFSQRTIAVGFVEDFSTNPLTHGWTYTGSNDTLFFWDSVNQNLHCFWNPSTTLSQFSRFPGFRLTPVESFQVDYNLSLINISNVQSYSNNPMVIGFYNHLNTGNRTANIIEFDYYPGTDTTYGGPNFLGISAIDTSGTGYSDFLFETPAYTLSTGVTYHVTLKYNSSTQMMSLNMTANGSPFGSFTPIDMSNFPFEMDRFGITNWFDGYDSFLIEGTIDDITVSNFIPAISTTWDYLVATDTSRFIYQSVPGTTGLPVISWLPEYNDATGVLKLTFTSANQGIKLTLNKGEWFSGSSSHWYEMATHICSNISGSNDIVPVSLLYNGVPPAPATITVQGAISLSTSWTTLLEIEQLSSNSNSLYPQLTIHNSNNSPASVYIDFIEVNEIQNPLVQLEQ